MQMNPGVGQAPLVGLPTTPPFGTAGQHPPVGPPTTPPGLVGTKRPSSSSASGANAGDDWPVKDSAEVKVLLGARAGSLAVDLYGKVIESEAETRAAKRLRNAIAAVQDTIKTKSAQEAWHELKTYVRVEAAKEALDLARIEQRSDQ